MSAAFHRIIQGSAHPVNGEGWSQSSSSRICKFVGSEFMYLEIDCRWMTQGAMKGKEQLKKNEAKYKSDRWVLLVEVEVARQEGWSQQSGKRRQPNRISHAGMKPLALASWLVWYNNNICFKGWLEKVPSAITYFVARMTGKKFTNWPFPKRFFPSDSVRCDGISHNDLVLYSKMSREWSLSLEIST